MTQDQEMQLTWAYSDGEPTEILARQYQCSKRTVERVAKRNGAKLRQETARQIADTIAAKRAEQMLRRVG